jgi:hypothetical protein
MKRDAYGVLVRRSDGQRELGRTRRRWDNNTEMDLEEMG